MTRDDVNAYFREITMTDAAIARANEIIDDILHIRSSEVELVFVCDQIAGEGRRTQNSLWLFTRDYVSEAKNFMTAKTFDYVSTPICNHLVDVSITDFDWKNTTDNSSMLVRTFFTDARTGMAFNAVRNNCFFLAELVKSRLVHPDILRG